MLPVEQILAAESERQSAEEGPADARPQTGDAGVLKPVIPQLLADELGIGLGRVRECAGKRDAIVVDPVPRSRGDDEAGPAGTGPRRGEASRARRNLEHSVADLQVTDVVSRHSPYAAVHSRQGAAQRQ